jgi:hypothetical protein
MDAALGAAVKALAKWQFHYSIGDNDSADRANHVRDLMELPAGGSCDTGNSSASAISFKIRASCR